MDDTTTPLICLPCVYQPNDVSCICTQTNVLNLQVDAILLEQDRLKISRSSTTHPLVRNPTAAGAPPPPAPPGEAIMNALKARAVCRKIAQDHPNKPITAVAEAAWQGQPDLLQGDSLTALSPHITERYGPVISCLTFANSNVIETSEGLVMIDCGTAQNAPRIYNMIRKLTDKPLHTVIYTHGHVDHIAVNHMDFQEPFTVVAQENCVARFDRYKKTNGYNTIINARQFQIGSTMGKSSAQVSFEASHGTGYSFMHEFRYPDRTYQEYLRFNVGEETFELFAGKGETDDATIIWMPERRFCFCGDFFIWNAPNAGNPQKVQRYPEEWISAARKILSLRPIIVFPGHGPPIIGEGRVREAFQNQALLLEGICSYAMNGINTGRSLQEIMSTVPIPPELVSKPYLRPNYDDPRWFVATLWRRYAGWYVVFVFFFTFFGKAEMRRFELIFFILFSSFFFFFFVFSPRYTFDVRHLLPVSAGDVGKELAKLVGGADKLAEFAAKIMDEGGPRKLGIALEIAEMAAKAEEGAKRGHEIRAQILRAMEKRETTLMARSIYRAAAIDSEKSKL